MLRRCHNNPSAASTGLDAAYGEGTVTRALEQRIARVGIEYLIVNSTFDPTVTDCCGFNAGTHPADEQHAWSMPIWSWNPDYRVAPDLLFFTRLAPLEQRLCSSRMS